MTEHIYRKFPDRAAVIQTLMNKDATFRETCADYEEMCTWLAAQSSSIDPHSAEYVHTCEIIRELEEEVEKRLKDSGLRI